MMIEVSDRKTVGGYRKREAERERDGGRESARAIWEQI